MANSERIETGKAPRLLVRCQGDMQIRSWAEPAVLVQSGEYETSESDKGIAIDGSSDLVLVVPAESEILIEDVAGDLDVRNLDGQLAISSVKGDAALQNLTGAEIAVIHGDLAARNLNGPLKLEELMGDGGLRNVADLELQKVYGDLVAHNVNGAVHIAEVMGDVSLKTVNGDVHVTLGHRDVNLRNLGGLTTIGLAHGDIRLRGGLAPGKHSLKADGDVVIRWPASEPLNVEGRAPRIRNRLPLEAIREEEGFFSGRLGDGETFLLLEAGGRIILKDIDATTGTEGWEEFAEVDLEFELGLEDLGQHIAEEINSRMDEWSTRMERKFGPEFAARMERTAQEAAARAEKAAERAMRKAEKAARRASWHSRRGAPSPSAPKSQAPQEPQATVEEQLKILKMVETGVITPDEANTLLEAIGS